jgi:hypothetical protein
MQHTMANRNQSPLQLQYYICHFRRYQDFNLTSIPHGIAAFQMVVATMISSLVMDGGTVNLGAINAFANAQFA